VAADPISDNGGAGGGPQGDDFVLPFQTVRSRISGRIVRLGSVAETVLSRHSYPDPVSEALGHALALTSLLGTTLNFDGRLILQTRSDGPLGFLVAQFDTPGLVRGYASFDPARVAGGGPVMGNGQLAMTIDPGEGKERYQGIVALERGGLAEAADAYFRQSEQLPTLIRLAVARHFDAVGVQRIDGKWRAGGLMIQHVAGEAASLSEQEEEEERLLGEQDDHWQRVRMLAATVEDLELIDPSLTAEELLIRLFHEEGVRVRPRRPIEVHCRCSRERVGMFLRSFGPDELAGMHESDGAIAVTCEFCATRYRFDPAEIART